MESLEFLQALPKQTRQALVTQADFCIGKHISFSYDQTQNSSSLKIALIGLLQNTTDLDKVREQFYQLKTGAWQYPIYDFGNLVLSNNPADNAYSLKQIITDTHNNGFCLLFISPDITHAYDVYRAYDSLKSPMNFAFANARIPINNQTQALNPNNLLNHMIESQPQNLLEFVQLGYQSYYHSEKELEAIEYMNLEAVSLGKIAEQPTELEAYLREIDAFAINLDSIQYSDFKSNANANPNGFNSREACALTKYAGLSNRLTTLLIANYTASNSNVDDQLLAQMLWYFVDGVNHRSDQPTINNPNNYERFFVQLPEQEIVFLKNNINQQWWLQITDSTKVPCTEKDYQTALNNQIPDRWWKAYKKYY